MVGRTDTGDARSWEEVNTVLQSIEGAPAGLSVSELMQRVNLSKGRIQKTLDLLSLESPAPLVKQGAKWQLTAADLGEEFWQRAERLCELRRQEQHEMRRYVDLSSGYMEFLIRALDGNPDGVSVPKLPLLPTVAIKQP